MSVGANRAYAERNPEVVKSFLRAYAALLVLGIVGVAFYFLIQSS